MMLAEGELQTPKSGCFEPCGDSRQAVPSFAIVAFPAVITAYNRSGIKVVVG